MKIAKIATACRLAVAAIAICFILAAASAAWAQEERESLILATTTSVENSGLLDFLLQRYRARDAVEIKVVARGTGQAFRIARNGDADLVLAHHPASEESFVAQGHGMRRLPVMFNHFILVGAGKDAANVAAAGDVFTALLRIAAAGEAGNAKFLSRGDESGTHRRERELWLAAGRHIDAARDSWYLETGAGMGATLSIASELQSYTLVDRGTWLSFGNKRGLVALLEETEALFNPYSVIAVNAKRHPHINAAAANRFVAWLTSAEGQDAIAAFRIDGKPCFFPARSDSWNGRSAEN